MNRRPSPDHPKVLPPSIGRGAELRNLEGLIEEHRLVCVSGPEGVGRSSVLGALARRISRSRSRVFRSRVFPGIHGAAFWESARVRMGVVGRITSARENLVRALREVERSGGTWILDDLDLLPGEDLFLLNALARSSLSRGRVVFSSVSGRGLDGGGLLELSPMPVEDLEELARQGSALLSLELKPRELASLAEECRGIPLLLKLRLVLRSPAAGRNPAGRHPASEPGGTLASVVAGLPERLLPGPRGLIQLLSVMGPGPTRALTVALSRREPEGARVLALLAPAGEPGFALPRTLASGQPGWSRASLATAESDWLRDCLRSAAGTIRASPEQQAGVIEARRALGLAADALVLLLDCGEDWLSRGLGWNLLGQLDRCADSAGQDHPGLGLLRARVLRDLEAPPDTVLSVLDRLEGGAPAAVRARILAECAACHLDLEEFAAARTAITRARELYEGERDSLRAGRALLTSSRVLLKEGNLEEAERTAALVGKQFQGCGRDLDGLTCLHLAEVHQAAGRREAARPFLKRGVRLLEPSSRPEILACALLALARDLDQQQDVREAQRQRERAMELYARCLDLNKELELRLDLGHQAFERGAYARSETWIQDGVFLLEAMDPSPLHARYEIALSLLHAHRGSLEAAHGNIARAGEILERCRTSQVETEILLAQGDLLGYDGHHEAAWEHLNGLFVESRRRGNTESLRRVLLKRTQIAAAWGRERELALALGDLDRIAPGSAGDRLWDDYLRAHLQSLTGSGEAPSLPALIARARRADDLRVQTACRLLQVDGLVRQGRITPALRQLELLYRMARKSGDIRGKLEVLLRQARLLLKAGTRTGLKAVSRRAELLTEGRNLGPAVLELKKLMGSVEKLPDR